MKLETCFKCKNRVDCRRHYIDKDGYECDEMYWYCLYDQTHEDNCQYYEPKYNIDTRTYTRTQEN